MPRIDHDLETLEETDRQLDALTIEGDGSSPAVLEKADRSKANVLTGVTNRNETNILACIYARSLGVKHTIARVSNPGHTRKDCGVGLKALGLDLTVKRQEGMRARNRKHPSHARNNRNHRSLRWRTESHRGESAQCYAAVPAANQ